MIDRQRVKTLREVLNHKLAELGEQLGMEIKTTGAANFTDNNVVFKVEMAELNSDGDANSREADEFKHACARWGMQESDLGRRFRHGGSTFELIGANLRAHKYPLIGKRYDGKRFKFHPDSVRRGFDALV